MSNQQNSDKNEQSGGSRHIIDHAISIPASHDDVWRILSQLQHNPQWQTDCQSIAFITTNRSGEGTRMRCIGAQGKEYVVEVTAWYERLGYEYIIVDGVPYGQNRGRIRLQEIAEGTVVQWSFSYELSGMFSGLRNNLGLKRTLDKHITESLRNLWRYMKEVSRQPELEDVRSLMRDAPDVDERASYEPRYPSLYEQFKVQGELQREPDPIEAENPGLASLLDEPAQDEDDTRPNPVVQESAAPEPASPETRRETGLSSALSAPSETPPTQVDRESAGDGIEPLPSSESEDDLSDTSRISVFEVFGLQKPSESQQIRTITPEEEAAAETTPESDINLSSEYVTADEVQPQPSTSPGWTDPMEAFVKSDTPQPAISESASTDIETTRGEIPIAISTDSDENLSAVSVTTDEADEQDTPEITASAPKRTGLRQVARQAEIKVRLPE